MRARPGCSASSEPGWPRTSAGVPRPSCAPLAIRGMGRPDRRPGLGGPRRSGDAASGCPGSGPSNRIEAARRPPRHRAPARRKHSPQPPRPAPCRGGSRCGFPDPRWRRAGVAGHGRTAGGERHRAALNGRRSLHASRAHAARAWGRAREFRRAQPDLTRVCSFLPAPRACRAAGPLYAVQLVPCARPGRIAGSRRGQVSAGALAGDPDRRSKGPFPVSSAADAQDPVRS